MSVIAKSELKKLIRDGVIKIDPFSEDQIGPGSVDLHLGSDFVIYKKVRDIYHITDRSDFREITEEIKVEDYFLILQIGRAHV